MCERAVGYPNVSLESSVFLTYRGMRGIISAGGANVSVSSIPEVQFERIPNLIPDDLEVRVGVMA